MRLPSGIETTDYSRTAAQKGWSSGWPSCQSAGVFGLGQIVGPKSVALVQGGVNKRIQLLCQLLISETERRGYMLVKGWCWGYSCRAIAGTSRPSNHCLTGDTLVTTPDGPVPIIELAGTDATVLTRDPYSDHQRGKWVTAPVRSFGVSDTVVVLLRSAQAEMSITCTPDHGWFVQRKTSRYVGNYRSEYHVVTERVVAADLKPGAWLASCLPPHGGSRLGPSGFGIAHGVAYGDGTEGSLILWGVKQELTRFFTGQPLSPRELDSGVVGTRVGRLPRFFKQFPSLQEDPAYLAGFLAGWIATDGHVRGREVRLSNATRENLEFAAQLAMRLGVATRPITVQKQGPGSYKEGSPTYSIQFVSATIPDWLFVRSDQAAEFGSVPTNDRFSGWKVVSVLPGEPQEVFCASVEGTHAFTLDNGLMTSNSWGLAMDINAPTNPYTSSGQHDLPDWFFAMFRRYGFGVGADYSGRKDWMHVEWQGTPGDADIMTQLAAREFDGTVTPPTSDWTDTMSLAEWTGVVRDAFPLR